MLLSARGGRVGQQRHLAGVLDRRGDVALVLRAVAGHPTSADLAAVGDELPQQRGVLVVDTVALSLQKAQTFFFGLRTTGLAIVVLPFRARRTSEWSGMVGVIG